MNRFRSARDEHIEIENRWRLLNLREAHLNVREKEVRQREADIRHFISTNPMMTSQIQTPVHALHPRMPRPRQTFKKHGKHKDYSQFAVRTEKETNTLKDDSL